MPLDTLWWYFQASPRCLKCLILSEVTGLRRILQSFIKRGYDQGSARHLFFFKPLYIIIEMVGFPQEVFQISGSSCPRRLILQYSQQTDLELRWTCLTGFFSPENPFPPATPTPVPVSAFSVLLFSIVLRLECLSTAFFSVVPYVHSLNSHTTHEVIF